MHLGLTYGGVLQSDSQTKASVTAPPYGFIGYADTDYASDPEDRMSVMGHSFYLSSNLLVQQKTANRINLHHRNRVYSSWICSAGECMDQTISK